MRVRTTWKNEEIVKRASMGKQADPYLMNQDHVRNQPSADKYVTGDPSSFGEDVNTDDRWKEEMGKRNEIGMPDFRRDTFNHPEKTAALDEALLLKKADLATTVARMMLAGRKFADERTAEQAVEDQAFNLMFLPDNALLDTHARLAAEQEEEEQEQQAQSEKPWEQGQDKQAQDQAQDQEQQGQGQQAEDPQTKQAALELQAALRSGNKAKINAALAKQVKVALTVAKKASHDQLVAQAQQIASEAAQIGALAPAAASLAKADNIVVQAAQLAQSAAQLAVKVPAKAVMAAKIAKSASKLAQDCMALDQEPTAEQMMQQAMQDQQAQQQEMTAEQQLAAQQAQREAMQAAQQVQQALAQQGQGQQGRQVAQQQGRQVAQQQGQGQQVAQQQGQGQQVAQQQGIQSMDDMLLNDMMGQAPVDDDLDMGVQLDPAPMDVGEIGLGPEDEVLTQLFTANQEVQDAQDAQQGQGQDKQAHVIRTASMRTVGTRPTGGVSKIGGAAGAPAAGGTEVNKLASLWQSAPDVRDAFGLPKS